MKKKIIIISIIGLLILTGFTNISAVKINTTTSNNEKLDQYQNETQGMPMPIGRLPTNAENISYQFAQSFIPTKEVLTKIELYLCKNETAVHPYNTSIRKELTGENLALSSVNPENINNLDSTDSTLNMTWVEFDFNDIIVDIGETYYIVSNTVNMTDNWYIWGCNNNSNSYEYGEAYMSIDDGLTWSNRSKTKPKAKPKMIKTIGDGNNQSDMCFKTYGRNATTLNIEFPLFENGLKTIIKNTGTVNTTGLFFRVEVKGGLLKGINETSEGPLLSTITPGTQTPINTPVFGFGLVDIKAMAMASNAKKVEKTARGIVILSYILVLPS
jgi:hypothetical protein